MLIIFFNGFKNVNNFIKTIVYNNFNVDKIVNNLLINVY